MTPSPVQLSLFDETSRKVLSSVGFVAGMKAAMRGMVEASGMSRDQVVDAMNGLVRISSKGRKGLCKGSKFISLSVLEKWLGDEDRAQLPDLWGLHILILATGNRLLPLEAWLALFGCGVLDEASRKKLEFAELELERESRDKRRRKLKAELMETR